MKYLINKNNQYIDYTKEEIQNLIDSHKIGLETEIWTEKWSEWKILRDTETDFDLKKAIYLNENKSADLKSDKNERIFVAIFFSFIYLIIICMLLYILPILSLIPTVFGRAFGKAAYNYIEYGKWELN
jgi:hypothetical protein